jgi:hypothetical protein
MPTTMCASTWRTSRELKRVAVSLCVWERCNNRHWLQTRSDG